MTDKYVKYIDTGTALNGAFDLISNIAGSTGPTGPAGPVTPAYGEMFLNVAPATIGLTTTPLGFVDGIAGLANNVTFVDDVTADQLRSDIDGVYQICCSIGVDLSSPGPETNFEIYKNGLPTGNIRSVVDIGNTITISICGIISLNINDYVSLYFYTSTGTRNMDLLKLNLSIIKVE